MLYNIKTHKCTLHCIKVLYNILLHPITSFHHISHRTSQNITFHVISRKIPPNIYPITEYQILIYHKIHISHISQNIIPHIISQNL